MNSELLSLRLQAVVNYIPQGFRLADIGSDHAYLPCHVVSKGMVPFAIAGEVVEGPFNSAVKQVQVEGFEAKISVRLGNGLEVINKGEVDCVTICGMGGTLISNILDRGQGKLREIKRLILQPNIGSRSLRQWLLEHDWMLINEDIVAEDGKVYEILVAEHGDPYTGYEKDDLEAGLLLGPYIMKQKNAAFIQKWQGEKANWQRILKQLQHAEDSLPNKMKKQELMQKIQIVEGVLGLEEN